MASFKDDGQNLILGLPFEIPYLDTSTVTIHKATFQTAVRMVVIICTYLLFRPHLEKLFRTVTGRDDPNALTPEELKARVEELHNETKGKKVYAVAGATGDLRKPAQTKTPTKSPASDGGKSGGSRRRKA